MPRRGEPLDKLGFLTIGRFDAANPGPGIEETLEVIERAEALGYDSVWLRCRHLQPGISSPVAIMAAASQRTSRIELGTAVIPLGLENPFRLAEDLATVDILSGGRINPGVSVGTPMLYDHYKEALYPTPTTSRTSRRTGCCAYCTRCGASRSVTSRARSASSSSPTASSRTPPAGRPALVRRRHDIRDLGRGTGHQLPDEFGRQYRGHRIARLRHPDAHRDSGDVVLRVAGIAFRTSKGR